MTELCKTRLEKLQKKGTKNEKMICNFILENENTKVFGKLQDISSHFKISGSSVSRFIEKLGYPSFKHFIYELNDEVWNTIVAKTKQKENKLNSELGLENIKGDFYFISSRNGKSISKFTRERLNVLNFSTNYFHEFNQCIDEYVSNINSHDIVILITLSGWSNTVSKGITALEKYKNKPKIIIFSVNKWTTKFDKYDYIKWVNLKSAQKNIDEFNDYNQVSLEFLELIIDWLNNLHKQLKNKTH